MPTHLLEALRTHATTQPDGVFCHLLKRGTWHDITYAHLARSSAAYAEGYRKLGLERGALVLVILEHSGDLFYAFLGAMLAGFVPCFLPFPSRKQSAERYWSTHRPLFERLDAGAVVTWTESAAAIRTAIGDSGVRVLESTAFEEALPSGAPLESVDASMDAIAMLQHSSGTTGMKKGVQLTYGAIAEHIDRLKDSVGFRETDRIASWLPLYHDMGLIACFIAPLTLGLSVAAIDPFEWVARPRLLFDAIERYRSTHVWQPNFAFHHLCATVDAADKRDLGSLKAIFDCSEPCKAQTLETFARTFADWGVRSETLQVAYGMAENVFLATQTTVGKPVEIVVADAVELASKGVAVPPKGGPAQRILSVGKPLGGVELIVTDTNGAKLPDDRVGEIGLRSTSLFSGYFRNEEATRKKFRNGYYFTGDVGFLRDGELYVLGRADDRIIVAGKNFQAHDIEYVTGHVPGTKPGRVAAIGVFSEAIGTEEVVVIAEALSDDRGAWPKLRDEIRRAVLTELNLSLRDVLVVSTGWIVKTTSGKMSREANLAKYLEHVRRAAIGSETGS